MGKWDLESLKLVEKINGTLMIDPAKLLGRWNYNPAHIILTKMELFFHFCQVKSTSVYNANEVSFNKRVVVIVSQKSETQNIHTVI